MFVNVECKVSVIIPAYNVAPYIVECLDSLLNQTFNGYEIICVDDCSTDNTYEVLKEYAQKDSRIRIYQNEANRGAAFSRNRGLEYAKGKYVIFLDSDDCYSEFLLEKLYDRCESDCSEAAFCLYSVLDEKNELKQVSFWQEQLTEKNTIYGEEDKKRILFQSPIFSPCNKLVLRELLLKEKIRFQELKNANDVYYTLMVMTYAESISIVDESLVYYRSNRLGNTSEYRDRVHSFAVYAFEEYILSLIQRNNWNETMQRMVLKMVIEQCFFLIADKPKKWAEQLMADFAERIHPYIKQSLKNSDLNLSKWNLYQYAYILHEEQDLKNKYQVLQQEIVEFLAGKDNGKIAIWGAGKLGRQFVEALGKSKEKIAGIIDNDVLKQGMEINGVKVYSYSEMECSLDEILVLNPRFMSSIKAQVKRDIVITDFDNFLRCNNYI